MDILSQARTLQHTALECIHSWNSAFTQAEDQAIQTFSLANEQKKILEQDCYNLALSKTQTHQEEAETLIALLLSAVMVSIPELQMIVDRTCTLLQSVPSSTLKTRLLIAFYTLTQDEEDKEDILSFFASLKGKEYNEEEQEAYSLFQEIEEWANPSYANS